VLPSKLIDNECNITVCGTNAVASSEKGNQEKERIHFFLANALLRYKVFSERIAPLQSISRRSF